MNIIKYSCTTYTRLPGLYKLLILLCLYLWAINPSYGAQCNENTPGQFPDRYTNLENGSTLDGLTGLIWQRCNLNQTWNTSTEACQIFVKHQTWRDSLQAIVTFNAEQAALSLPSNWRMPNLKELTSIIDINCNPSINDTIFLENDSVYWSSTPHSTQLWQETLKDGNGDATGMIQDENMIWIVNTFSGKEDIITFNALLATRLVRNQTNP